MKFVFLELLKSWALKNFRARELVLSEFMPTLSQNYLIPCPIVVLYKLPSSTGIRTHIFLNFY